MGQGSGHLGSDMRDRQLAVEFVQRQVDHRQHSAETMAVVGARTRRRPLTSIVNGSCPATGPRLPHGANATPEAFRKHCRQDRGISRGAPGGRTLNQWVKSSPAQCCGRAACTDATVQWRLWPSLHRFRRCAVPRPVPRVTSHDLFMPNTGRYSGQAGPIHVDPYVRALCCHAPARARRSYASAWLRLMTGPSADSSLASIALVHTVAAQNAWISSCVQGLDPLPRPRYSRGRLQPRSARQVVLTHRRQRSWRGRPARRSRRPGQLSGRPGSGERGPACPGT